MGSGASSGRVLGKNYLTPSVNRHHIESPTCRPTILELVHSLDVGGAERLVERTVMGLSGWRFVVACLDYLGDIGKQLIQQGIPVFCLERCPGIDWRCVWRLRALVRKHAITVIHAHQYTPFSYALLGRLGGSQPPIVFTEHGRHQPDYRRWRRVWVNRLLTRRQDRIVAVGQAVKKALVCNEGFSEQRIQVIYNGIPLEQFSNVPVRGREARAQLGIRDEAFVVAHVARLDYLKDHRTALEAIACLRDNLPEVVYLVVGDGPLQKEISQRIVELRLESHVRLLGTRQDVPLILAASDAFMLSSISEGIPLTVIEAMAAGVPLVATRVGGLEEMIDDGVQGVLRPPKDPRALASALLSLARNPELRAQMGRAGRQRAQERFSETTMLAAYDDLFAHLTSQIHPPST